MGFGCTYYDSNRPSSCDAHPTVSCWDGVWFVYLLLLPFACFFISCFALLNAEHMAENEPMTGKDWIIAKTMETALPSSQAYVKMFGFWRLVSVTIFVAIGRWHPTYACGSNAVLFAVLLAYTVVSMGHVARGDLAAGFAAALIDDPSSSLSIIQFVFPVSAWVGLEAKTSSKVSPG